MELKYDRETNVCEYFNEKNGSIIHVLSNDTGLWFNLNDTFKMFGMIKSSKLWISKNLTPEEKWWIEFYRKEGKARELFIPEQTMHKIISKIQGDFNDNVDFVYGIIADYDNTCINIKDMELNVEERIALHALKAESTNYAERVKKYNDVLKGKTHIGEYYDLYDREIDKKIKESQTIYDNEKCPEDLRQEQIEKERVEREKARESKIKPVTDWDILNNAAESLDNGMEAIYNVINNIDEDFFDIGDHDVISDPSMFIYDEMAFDIRDINDGVQYVRNCIDEKANMMNLIIQDIQSLEKEHREGKLK